jgi:hypothetical protein
MPINLIDQMHHIGITLQTSFNLHQEIDAGIILDDTLDDGVEFGELVCRRNAACLMAALGTLSEEVVPWEAQAVDEDAFAAGLLAGISVQLELGHVDQVVIVHTVFNVIPCQLCHSDFSLFVPANVVCIC